MIEELKELFDIDIENGKFFWKLPSKYHPDLLGKEAGFATSDYWVIKINGKAYKRGRLVFLCANGKFPYPCIDHINGIKTDDRLNNLREATITQNNWNHRTRKKSNDLPMGIRKNGNKFVARIAHNKNQITIGSFETLEEAHSAYKQKRIELYGQYSSY